MDAELFRRAIECDGRGEADKAAELYSSIDALAPNYVGAQINLGRLRHVAGSLDEAERHYRAALDIEPDHVTGRFNLGVVLEDRGARYEAMEQYRKAIELDRYHGDARFNLARLHKLECVRQWMAYCGLRLKGMV